MNSTINDWKDVEALLQARFGKVPDLEGILYLIGINELGSVPIEGQSFSKEQKQDLMHIGVCRVLQELGYYEFTGRDDDGWPHYQALQPIEERGLQVQESLLKAGIMEYCSKL